MIKCIAAFKKPHPNHSPEGEGQQKMYCPAFEQIFDNSIHF
jgi:hypothetical protein